MLSGTSSAVGSTNHVYISKTKYLVIFHEGEPPALLAQARLTNKRHFPFIDLLNTDDFRDHIRGSGCLLELVVTRWPSSGLEPRLGLRQDHQILLTTVLSPRSPYKPYIPTTLGMIMHRIQESLTISFFTKGSELKKGSEL